MHRLTRGALALLLGAFIAGVSMFLVPGVLSPLTGHAQGQIVAPELSPNLGWLNTDRPLRFDEELKGHVVLLDFWTYCCINCIHVLPDLEYLEHKYADEPFVAIGVHSAKFTNEGERESIRQAMFRYDIEHPVVIDSGMNIWQKYGIRGWPGFVVIGTDGRVVGVTGGEGQRAVLDQAISDALAAGRERGDIAETRVTYELDAMVTPATGLTFPGKVLADSELGYVMIADSSADRVVVTSYPDSDGRSELVQIVGSGERGLEDGLGEAAALHDPQGMVLDRARGLVYIADTKNHAIRALDLASWSLTTIAGTGVQSYDRRGGGIGTSQAISSPWDLELSPDGRTLYIAMAGPHQIWHMDLESRVVERLAGSGRENALDGPLEDAALAQPSGLSLSSDGRRLYFADSESSSVRVVDLDAREVRTVVGHTVASLLENGLFEFGDIDGAFPTARLQHVLGVARLPDADGGGDRVLVADTYNHKLKVVEASAQRITTLAGGRDGEAGGPALDEPGGVEYDAATGLAFVADTNNHRVVIYDIETGGSNEMTISGLGASGEPAIDASGAEAVSVAFDVSAAATIELTPNLPEGATLNGEFPITVRIARPEDQTVLAQRTLRTTDKPLAIELAAGTASAGDALLVELSLAWCAYGDNGTCRPANLAWLATVEAGEGGLVALSAPVE
ncbi:MAG: thioredoxin-like domain-containing protein [Planctomycetota bacterium]